MEKEKRDYILEKTSIGNDLKVYYTGKKGVTDLIPLKPLNLVKIGNFSSGVELFIPAIDITIEEYKQNPKRYEKAVEMLNEIYIDTLKASGEYGEEYSNEEPYYKRYAVKEETLHTHRPRQQGIGLNEMVQDGYKKNLESYVTEYMTDTVTESGLPKSSKKIELDDLQKQWEKIKEYHDSKKRI